MPEEESPEILKLRHSIVSKRAGLITFLAHDADTDMRRLYHVDIVGSIPYRKCHLLAQILANHRDDLCLLRWCGPVHDYSLSFNKQFLNKLAQGRLLICVQDQLHRVARDDKTKELIFYLFRNVDKVFNESSSDIRISYLIGCRRDLTCDWGTYPI